MRSVYRQDPPTADEIQRKAMTDRRTKILLALGGITALGLGAYFGMKKGSSSIVKELEKLKTINIQQLNEMNTLVDYTYFVEKRRRDALDVIDTAMVNNIEFTHFPGVGVFSKEMPKVYEILDKKPPISDVVKKVKKSKKK